ncbi:transcriptional regulator [Bacillaceae bacterium W0354]
MSLAIDLTKSTFKKIEAEWFNYHRTLKEINILREEIMNPYNEEVDHNVGGGKSNEVGKPTERIATRLTTNKQLKYLTEVTEAIEEVYNALPDDYKKLVQLRYWSKSRQLTWDGIALELNISRRQALYWRKEIIQATSEVLGWR